MVFVSVSYSLLLPFVSSLVLCLSFLMLFVLVIGSVRVVCELSVLMGVSDLRRR